MIYFIKVALLLTAILAVYTFDTAATDYGLSEFAFAVVFGVLAPLTIFLAIYFLSPP